jgi:hypothetical protein
VLLPSNTCRKVITSIIAALFPFVTYSLTLPHTILISLLLHISICGSTLLLCYIRGKFPLHCSSQPPSISNLLTFHHTILLPASPVPKSPYYSSQLLLKLLYSVGEFLSLLTSIFCFSKPTHLLLILIQTLSSFLRVS